ncbi:MAG: hypothetical protein ACK46M_24860 [Planctomyces sp.]
MQPGAGWGTADNLRFQQIMDEHMVPQFKQGQFAQGIVGGVIALDKMARGLKVPARTRSTAEYSRLFIVAAVVIFTAVSLSRKGTQRLGMAAVGRTVCLRLRTPQPSHRQRW